MIEPLNINLELDVDAGISGFSNYHWVLDRAFPKSIVNESFSDAAQNEISQFNVEFSYKSWQGEILNASDKGKLGITATGSIGNNVFNQLTNKIYNTISKAI